MNLKTAVGVDAAENTNRTLAVTNMKESDRLSPCA
jgi:hypothetical protein